MNIPDEAAVQAAHAAICEQNFDDCLEWRGRCVKAVEAAAPYLLAEAWHLAYWQGIIDERLGLDALECGPDRPNPYRSQA